MRILILGGTAFLGRQLAAQGVARGHDVTCAARGSAPAPVGTTLVPVDRDADDALAPLADEPWDAVIDVTRQPGHARRAVRDLSAVHWVLVSSASVYAGFDRREQDESSPVHSPLEADVMASAEQYGAAKVACEGALRRTDSWTVLRVGLIGGAGDWSGRSGYYPWRFGHPTGPDVLMPPLDFPTAMIDVSDVAGYALDCAERRVCGIYNTTGPTVTLGEVAEASRAVSGSAVEARPVPEEILRKAGVAAWSGPRSLPLWLDDPAWRWFATLDTSAARAAGLTTRPLADTLAAGLAFEETRQERPAGLTDEEERELRAQL